MSFFEASKEVVTGNVYLIKNIELNGAELNSEIKDNQGELTNEMILEYGFDLGSIKGKPQIGEESFYRKRTIEDNRIDTNETLKELFNFLRIVDNERCPAHFELNGVKYI